MATSKKNDRNNGNATHNQPNGGDQMKKVNRFYGMLVALLVTMVSILAIAQDNFEDDFELEDDSTESYVEADAEADAEADIEADAEADADLGDLLGDEEASDTGGSKNPDLFKISDGITLTKLVQYVCGRFYTVINRDYVSTAKENVQSQLGDDFEKVDIFFGDMGVNIPFTGLGEDIDTEMESAIVSYAKGHGCEGNDKQSDDCDALFSILKEEHGKAVSGVDNSYTRNSAKMLETAKLLYGIDKITLGLGALAMATPGVPENQRPWDISDSDFNGVPIDFGDIEEGDKIVTDGKDGLTGGTVTEKTDDSLTFVDEDGNEHTVSKDAKFWTLGSGSSGVANLPGSAISFILGTSGIALIGKDIKGAWMLTVDFDLMWRINTHLGVFVGASMITHAWGTSTSGLEDTLTSGADRMYGYGRAGVAAGVNINKVWRFEGTAALLFNTGVGAEATIGLSATPHPVVTLGFGARGGFYPGTIRTGSREYGIGGTTNGPNLLNRPGLGGFLTIGINLPIGEEE